MNFHNLFDERYHIEHLDAKPIYIEMPAKAFSLPYNADIPVYRFTCALLEDGQLDWLIRQEDITDIGQAVIDLEQRSPGYFHVLHEEWKKRYTKLMEWYQVEFKKDLSALDDGALVASIDGLMAAYLQTLNFPAFFDAFMFHADQRLNELLIDYKKSHQTSENANILYSILSSPVDDSFLNEMENDLIAIANRKIQGEDITQVVKDHQKKYSYVNSGYGGYEEYSESLIRRKIEELLTGGRLVPNVVSQNNRLAKAALFAKYDFSDEIVRLAKLTELLTKWQDERKAVTMTYVALDEKHVREVASRTGLPYDDIVYADHEELKAIVEGKRNLQMLRERQNQPYLRVYQGGRIVISECGDKARQFKERCVQELQADLKEVRGFAASIGRAIGPVRLIRTFEDGKAMQQGDVLVISMTRPEHVPFMKKAAAIVTDDGGITCHAAIVARELGKPCVIGTKLATKTFKDGDMVEVDADHGVVKLISAGT